MKYRFIVKIVFTITILFSACKRDEYLIGGTTRSNQVNMSTYDYMKSNSMGLFDTVLLLIDKLNLKDSINKNGITFFAPTDYSVYYYLVSQTLKLQQVDPYKKWTFDSLVKYDLPKFRDSIRSYIVTTQVPNSILTEQQMQFNTAMPGSIASVSYEKTTDPSLGYNPSLTTQPQIVYYWYNGLKTRVQTSNIQTTTGYLQVLANPTVNSATGRLTNDGNILFFRK